MRSFLGLILFALISACATPSSMVAHPRAPVEALNEPHGRVLVAAHRGCWKTAPENSLAALEACARLGVDIVEVDLRLTADGEVVLSHDATARRMAGVDRAIEHMTAREIAALRLRPGDGRSDTTVTDQPMPTLRSMVRANAGRMLLILDLKSDPAQLAPVAARILREENACSIAMFALVATPDEARDAAGPLLDCAAFLPNLRVPMGPMSEVARSFAPLNPVAVAVRFDDWSYLYEGVDDVARMPARIWVNTLDEYHAAGLTDADALVDPEILWGRLVDAGVNIIQTDEPEALLTFLAQRSSRSDQLMRIGHDPQSAHVMVEAHRGAWSAAAPENSLAAIERAIALGADMIELDVRVTRDGEVVLIHDAKLDRTTTLSGRVDETDAVQILTAHLKTHDGAVTAQRPMLLRDVLPFMRGRILLRLDVKCRPACDAVVYRTLLAERFTDQLVVYESALAHLQPAAIPPDRILVIGRQVDAYGEPAAVPKHVDIVQFKEFDPMAPPIDIARRFRDTHRIVAAPHNDQRAGLHGDDASLLNPDNGWGWLMDAGADVMLTDEVESLIDYLTSKGARNTAGLSLGK